MNLKVVSLVGVGQVPMLSIQTRGVSLPLFLANSANLSSAVSFNNQSHS